MFACKCLNVTLTASQAVEVTKPQQFDQQEFFEEDLVRVQSSALTVQHECLVQTIIKGNWTIYKCCNCDVFTHAASLKTSDVLVNYSLKITPSELNAKRKQDNYSPVFRIIIQPIAKTINGDSRQLRERMEEQVKREKLETEKRIKQFMEREYLKLDVFIDRAKFDLDQLSRNTVKSQVEPVEVKQTPAPPQLNEMPTKEIGHVDDDLFRFNVAAVLDLDESEQHTDETESEDEVDERTHDDHYRINGIARSLPISVPAYLSARNAAAIADDDIDDDDHPVDIAASIKALAQSVHGDAIFGDLPRPRFSTRI